MTSSQTSAFPRRALLIIMLIALMARLILLASSTVSFHADEAIVGLMARHILQGERPTFFYGQPYMGSLDAWLVTIGFRLFGDSVLTIRIVQSILYVLAVAMGFIVAWRFSGRTVIAAITGLLLAVPTVNVALYTTATLGGYNETLFLGSALLWLGYEATHDHARSWPRWGLLGLCVGVGWWTNGLIVVYVLPVGILILYTLLRGRSLRQTLPFLLLALAAFFVGSAPWWIFDFSHNHAALGMYLSSRQSGEFAGIGIPYVPPLERVLGLVIIGLPALVGMRFPWSSEYFWPLVGIAIILIYVLAILRLLRRPNPLKPDARGLILGMLGLFCIVFVASTFGADPTGRYFVPLSVPLGIVLATLVHGLMAQRQGLGQPHQNLPPLAMRERGTRGEGVRRLLPFALAALVIGYQAAGQIAAASTPPGFTTQFDPVSHIPNDHDAELIAFLDAHQLYNGYTNYWVAFRLAFLTDERMQYSSALPYKADLSYNAADNRYPPYRDATENAAQIAFITTNLPELDTQLENTFDAQNITYQQARIGLFHIYYDFQPHKPTFALPASTG